MHPDTIAPMRRKARLADEALTALAQGQTSDGVDARLAREVLALRRRLHDAEQRRHDGRRRRTCLSALQAPGTVREVADRLGWPYSRARAWVHHLLRTGAIVRVDTVRSASGQHAGKYIVS